MRGGRLMPAAEVQRRYGVSHMTLNRWRKCIELGFPQSITINGRRYWHVSELVNWERSQAGKAR